MPSKKLNKQLRIAMTPSQELADALRDFSAATGLSQSRLCVTLLTDAIPMMRKVTASMTKAKSGDKVGALDVFAGMLSDAGIDLRQHEIDMEALRKEVIS